MRSIASLLVLSHLVCGLAGCGLGALIVRQLAAQGAPSHERVASLVYRQATALAFQFAPGEQVLKLLQSRPAHAAASTEQPYEDMLNSLREASLFGDGKNAAPQVGKLMNRATNACLKSRDRDCRPESLAARRRSLTVQRSRGRSGVRFSY